MKKNQPRLQQQPRFQQDSEDELDIDSRMEDSDQESGSEYESGAESQDLDSRDQMKSVSFQALAKAQNELENENQYNDSNSDQEDVPTDYKGKGKGKNMLQKRRNKHAPAEMSAKRPVSVIREIPGLSSTSSTKTGTLYRDIRFDPAYGKADLAKARKDYAFLNEYRESELNEMKRQLKETRDEYEKDKLQAAIKSLSSRLKTLKDRDLQHEIMKKVNQKHNGKYLTRAQKRELILTEKFKKMKKKDVDRAIERRRKKNLSKERKSMPDRRER